VLYPTTDTCERCPAVRHDRLAAALTSLAHVAQVYVQHKMQEHGTSLCEALMEKGAFLYVCGDGARMASDVHSAVRSLLQEHGEMDVQEADHFLRDLVAEKRYLKDVWQ
jgi:sulfite reductase (NADPH) flavoprotein alpha-component